DRPGPGGRREQTQNFAGGWWNGDHAQLGGPAHRVQQDRLDRRVGGGGRGGDDSSSRERTGGCAERKRGWRPEGSTRRVILGMTRVGGDRAVAGGTGLDPSTQLWWSDGSNDPWRDPSAQTVIVSRAEAAPPPEEPPTAPPTGQPAGTARLVVTVALLTGLLAGA